MPTGQALPQLAKGGFYHAGQVCVSVQRIYAHRSIVDGSPSGLAEHAAKLRVGDPPLAETEVGPLIRPGEVERVDEWVEEAVAKGARAALRGQGAVGDVLRADRAARSADGCRVSTQEVFGPVVCVYAYDDLDDAIARANALPGLPGRGVHARPSPPRCAPTASTPPR